jgi:hypothetical protein
MRQAKLDYARFSPYSMGEAFAQYDLFLPRREADLDGLMSAAFEYQDEMNEWEQPSGSYLSEKAVEFLGDRAPRLAASYDVDDWTDFWEGAFDAAKGACHDEVDYSFGRW